MNNDILLELMHDAWMSAATAYRMYPDNKHTFSDYWDAIGELKAREAIKKWEDSSGKETGMKWVKASERLPKNKGMYFCRLSYTDKATIKRTLWYNDGCFESVHYNHENIIWLDETVPPYKEEVDKFGWEYEKGLMQDKIALLEKLLESKEEVDKEERVYLARGTKYKFENDPKIYDALVDEFGRYYYIKPKPSKEEVYYTKEDMQTLWIIHHNGEYEDFLPALAYIHRIKKYPLLESKEEAGEDHEK